ncbi:MAG TPA: carbohydrate ABC transporter permease [Candidatus Limiplasma sp.]|nr:carbohydrate ABC transporter permease [Candidatus Limiplasma sp.]HRX07713.1 carbohydrate ABC transporter permease [Candidatus Limiplasma sp.]
MEKLRKQIRRIEQSPVYADVKNGVKKGLKEKLFSVFRFVIILGISYVILAPVIGLVSSSFFSNADAYSPTVFTIPMAPTLERYQRAIVHLKYLPTLGRTMLFSISLTLIQLMVCSMAGYGFARFRFPLKKLLFACVVVMIVIPSYTIMLPLYVTFRDFDPLGLVTLLTGAPINLMGTTWPVYIMTGLGCGLRSGLFIYIFNQFFRGLPREIEEAAFVDGAGTWYTYFRIMLLNAMPAVITVSVFSLVWQYNDTFFGRLFLISNNVLLSKRVSSLQVNIRTLDKIMDPSIQQLYVSAGIVLLMLPMVILYLLLQKKFVESVERSGIVG